MKRPTDKRAERFAAADRKIHSRAWTEAVRVLARDPGARVPCPACGEGRVTADWLAFASGSGGEWVAQCVDCGAWHSEARAKRDRRC